MSVTGCLDDCAQAEINDIGLWPARQDDTGGTLGFNSDRDDWPAWGNNALFPDKELWVVSSCRMAHVLAYVGAPDSVTGSASDGSGSSSR